MEIVCQPLVGIQVSLEDSAYSSTMASFLACRGILAGDGIRDFLCENRQSICECGHHSIFSALSQRCQGPAIGTAVVAPGRPSSPPAVLTYVQALTSMMTHKCMSPPRMGGSRFPDQRMNPSFYASPAADYENPSYKWLGKKNRVRKFVWAMGTDDANCLEVLCLI